MTLLFLRPILYLNVHRGNPAVNTVTSQHLEPLFTGCTLWKNIL